MYYICSEITYDMHQTFFRHFSLPTNQLILGDATYLVHTDKHPEGMGENWEDFQIKLGNQSIADFGKVIAIQFKEEPVFRFEVNSDGTFKSLTIT